MIIDHKTIHRGIAVALFLLIEAVYLMTMAPTLSFWDCGEFIATSYTLGVPHPPGAPLFLLVGRLFSMVPFFEDIGARVNLLSTLSASATVMLTYLIIFRLIVMYRKSKPDSWDVPERLSAYGGAVVGALALAFSDSFWFNAVETEVYAPSLFFTALVVWFILRWFEDDPQEGSERWLMAAMYVIGLSIGVHLLSLLAIFAVAMVYYFKKQEVSFGNFILYLSTASVAFTLLIATGFSAMEWGTFTTEFSKWEYLNESARWGLVQKAAGVLAVFAFFSAIVYVSNRYIYKRYSSNLKSRFALINILHLVFILLAYVINMNSILLYVIALDYCIYLYHYFPKSFVRYFLGSIGLFFLIYSAVIKGLPILVQYGSWLGIALLSGGIVYVIYYSHIRRYKLLHTLSMSLLLLIVGYTSYALIYVRANASPSINENNPSTAKAFFSYLNREQYGDFGPWPRRWSEEPVHQYFYQQYGSDLDYFFRYQLNHMYLRYLGWQFIGRENDSGGAGVDWSKLWGLPFLIGVFGAVSHFRRDWKMGSVVTALFILTGAALVVYLNQTEPQPRERDYSYTGSFFAFAIWIGIGVESLYAWLKERLKLGRAVLIDQWTVGFAIFIGLLITAGIAAAVSFYFNWPPLYVGCIVVAIIIFIGIVVEIIWYIFRQLFEFSEKNQQIILVVFIVAAGLLLLDGRMLYANYHTHDRSGNYVPWDWAWNMLQSCEKDAILFTNGDNDTFPLWYLQEVEGIRTDVRVVNLSLANTGWYLDQLKNTSPNGAKKIAFSLSDEEIKDIGYVAIQPVEVDLPAGSAKVKLVKEYKEAGLDVPEALVDTLRWQIMPTITYQGQGFLRPQDVAVYEILMNNYTTRPIYFAITVGRDNLLGIDEYLRLDGLAYKVVPVRNIEEGGDFVEVSRLWTNLCSVFRYRHLNNPEVYIEETARRLSGSYKPLFASLAVELAEKPDEELSVRDSKGVLRKASRKHLAIEALDKSQEVLPLERYELDPGVAASVVSLYVSFDEKDKADPYIAYLEGRAGMTTLKDAPRVYYALALALREVGRVKESEEILDRLFEEIDEKNIDLN